MLDQLVFLSFATYTRSRVQFHTKTTLQNLSIFSPQQTSITHYVHHEFNSTQRLLSKIYLYFSSTTNIHNTLCPPQKGFQNLSTFSLIQYKHPYVTPITHYGHHKKDDVHSWVEIPYLIITLIFHFNLVHALVRVGIGRLAHI